MEVIKQDKLNAFLKCGEAIKKLKEEGMKTFDEVKNEAINKNIKYKRVVSVGLDFFSYNKITVEVLGETFQIKEDLKKFGFWFDINSKSWHKNFNPEELEEVKKIIKQLIENKLVDIAYVNDEVFKKDIIEIAIHKRWVKV
jgi:NAD+--asparagine ADP-ribosyltransferase